MNSQVCESKNLSQLNQKIPIFVFSNQKIPFFSRGRMDMRVGAFESPISQLLQEFLFVFIVLLKKFTPP